MRTALFWVTTQRVVAIPYRRFGTTYRSCLQGSRLTLKDVADMSRNVGKELPNNPGQRSSLSMRFCTSRQILGQYVKAADEHSPPYILQFIVGIIL
jgi:hypothetical protein